MRQIYLHGLGQTSVSWEKTMKQLNSVDDSICPNLADLLHDENPTYPNLYTAFSKFCNNFHETIDLCGLSLGGVLSLNYALDYPEKVNSLVLIAPQYKMPKGLLLFQNILFRFMPQNMFRQTGFGKAGFLRLCKSMMELDFSKSISQITCPTLIIYGEKDSANKKAAVKLAGILKNARLQMIPNSGHEVNIDAPENLAEMLCDFYKQVQ